MLTSISATERVKLWDRFTGPVDQQAVKLEFFRKVHRKNPPFRVKLRLSTKNRVQVPAMVKHHYRKPVLLLPSLKSVLRLEAVCARRNGVDLIEEEVKTEEADESSSTESNNCDSSDVSRKEDAAQSVVDRRENGEREASSRINGVMALKNGNECSDGGVLLMNGVTNSDGYRDLGADGFKRSAKGSRVSESGSCRNDFNSNEFADETTDLGELPNGVVKVETDVFNGAEGVKKESYLPDIISDISTEGEFCVQLYFSV